MSNHGMIGITAQNDDVTARNDDVTTKDGHSACDVTVVVVVVVVT